MLHTVVATGDMVRESLDFQGVHSWRRPKQSLNTMRSARDPLGKHGVGGHLPGRKWDP